MGLFRSLRGFAEVMITSADLAQTLEAAARAGIVISGTSAVDALSVRVTIARSDYRTLASLCSRRGDQLRLVKRGGLYWTGKGLLRRPVLLLGMLLFCVAAMYFPSRVFFVRVEGNTSVPTRLILEAADQCGMKFGASRREVRSERVKNALLEAVPQLQWAGVNTYGCVAVISVRERAAEAQPLPESDFGHIVALRDGIVTEGTALRGTLLCTPGQAVSQGDILISGYTDCGLCIRAEQAEGEIFAQTRRTLEAVMPSNRQLAVSNGREQKKISLLVGKKRINLWKDSGIWDATCDRIYEEYYITLPGGFQLPVALVVERFTFRETREAELPQDQAREELTQFANRYLQAQMVAGQILSPHLDFAAEPGGIRMAGEYVCVEMIGKMQRETIGEYNGESD